MNRADLLPISAQLSVFADIPPAEREELLQPAQIRAFAKGMHLYHHGDTATAFYIVASGAVRNYRETPDGKEITLAIAIMGDTLGEFELFGPKSNYQSSAVAVEDAVMLEYPMEWIGTKLREHSTLALNMLAAISRSSSWLAVDREHLVTLKTPQRVACFLLRLCTMYQLNPQQFDLPYSKSTIASKLGMEPESFSRALAKLRDVGVQIQGAEVRIEDVRMLESYVCNSCSISEDCDTCDQIHETSERLRAALR